MMGRVALKGDLQNLVRPLQPTLNPSRHIRQRRIQMRRVGAAGLGHIRTPATFAAYSLSYLVDEFTGRHLADSVFCNASDQQHLAVLYRRQYDRGLAKLVFELVERVT